MILKTLRCKQPNQFGQLVRYVLSERSKTESGVGEGFMVAHHIRAFEEGGITEAFARNDVFRKKRKNGVAMYHEILSWHEEDGDQLTMEAMEDMARHYIELRGENALCIAAPHFDRSHRHIHFLFSGTEYKSHKTLRMDNKRFEDIRRGIELYQREKYPELTKSIVHTNKPRRTRVNSIASDRNTRKERAYQAKRRSSKKLDKEILASTVADTLKKVSAAKQFFALLEQQEGIELYTYRKKITGIIYNGRKYRFSTLGIAKEQLIELRGKEQQIENRLSELEQIRKAKSLKREKSKAKGGLDMRDSMRMFD